MWPPSFSSSVSFSSKTQTEGLEAVGWVMTHPTVLGEAVAIGILTDLRATYNEDFPGFTLTRFDGSTIVV